MSRHIGSGDIPSLMAGVKTKKHQELINKFMSGEKPNYNAYLSPINQLRTGKIIEDRYARCVDLIPQWHVVSDDMNVFAATLDYVRLENRKVVYFEEVKSIWHEDFDKLPKKEVDREIYIRHKKKDIYNQVQEQIYCSKLMFGVVTFIAVYSYEDEINYSRNILESEILKTVINRDEAAIHNITKRGLPLQKIKDLYGW